MSAIKIIKFDLPIDGVKVKSLEELRDHFTVEIIDLYYSGTLIKWLRSRNMTEELSLLESLEIDASDHFLLLKKMCETFKVEVDDTIISIILNEAPIKKISSVSDIKNNKVNYRDLASKIDQLIYSEIFILAPHEIKDYAKIIHKSSDISGKHDAFYGKEKIIKAVQTMRRNLLLAMAESVLIPELSDQLLQRSNTLSEIIRKIPEHNEMSHEYFSSKFPLEDQDFMFNTSMYSQMKEMMGNLEKIPESESEISVNKILIEFRNEYKNNILINATLNAILNEFEYDTCQVVDSSEIKSKSEAEKYTISGKYLIYTNGTVVDTETKLMWKQNSETGEYKWSDAMAKFNKNTSFAGYSDWRMPTQEELKTLVDKRHFPTINPIAFPNTPSTYYWSYAERGASVAWFVYFYDGYVARNYRDGTSHVRLVRSCQ